MPSGIDLPVDRWLSIGRAQPGALADARRQMHHSMLGLVELGKSWATRGMMTRTVR
jgi:hypothetical protein